MVKRTTIPKRPGYEPRKYNPEGPLASRPHKTTTIKRNRPAPAPVEKPAAKKPTGKALDSGNKTVTIKHVSSSKGGGGGNRGPSFIGSMITGDASLVVGGVVVATGLTVLKQLLDSKLSMRPIIGGFVIGTGLLMLALISTPVATALALLILTTSVLTNGSFILQKALRAAE